MLLNNSLGKINKRENTKMNYECDDKCSTCPSIGSFNRKRYDHCSYKKKLNESTSPLQYNMSRYKFENCSACTFDGKYYAPFDLVDYESELRNITRPDSHCDELRYNPSCKKSALCTSTFDSSNPVVFHKDICPVVCNNIKKMKTPGYVLDERQYCGRNGLRQKKSEMTESGIESEEDQLFSNVSYFLNK